MCPPAHVAVFDIGKTNAKLALVDRARLAELAVLTTPNLVLPGPPWPHFDTDRLWRFLLDGLRAFHAAHGVDAISITTHGAAAAWLTATGVLAAPVLDYEHEGPETTRTAYDALRPPFSETGSPALPLGLNLGAQLFWQMQQDDGLRHKAATLLTYPQYWAARLTGKTACDVTSLGCHTDLWHPAAGRVSTLVERLGLSGHLAPALHPDAVLGPILPEIAAGTGLSPETPVVCGIHDSNASLLPHLAGRIAPFSVVSTGTWVIAMAIGGSKAPLDEARDTLVNVSARGDPVPSARFMGGREYEILCRGRQGMATEADIASVLARGAMQLPAVETSSGPFAGQAAPSTFVADDLSDGEKDAVAAFYLALVTAECLALIGALGDVIVEGPFARNDAYLKMLAAATLRPTFASLSRTGTSIGAALLYPGPPIEMPLAAVRDRRLVPDLCRYADDWRRLVGDRSPAVRS